MSSGELMLRPFPAGNPISIRTVTSPDSGEIVQAVRERISWPQRLTESSPLFPEPLALN